ncbi:hypothetical protein TMatcc_000203 [Talaromyces marneffei ATCC 18224]
MNATPRTRQRIEVGSYSGYILPVEVSVRIELNLFDVPSTLTHKDFMELALCLTCLLSMLCTHTVQYRYNNQQIEAKPRQEENKWKGRAREREK